MAVARLRDIGEAAFLSNAGGPSGSANFGCLTSATVTLDSEILRAKCGNAISERYQGITGLSVEIVLESISPVVDIHPGMFGVVALDIPGIDPDSGFPSLHGLYITVSGVVTSTSRKFNRNAMASGTYTIRGVSTNGITCPITLSLGDSVESDAGPSSFIRDISFIEWGGPGWTSGNFCGESFEVTEASTLIEDGCQGHLWPTYVGVSGLNITATATGKGVKMAFDSAKGGTTCLGMKGEITVYGSVGTDTDCAATVNSAGLTIYRANVTSLTITATSGEIATVSLSWTGAGATGELTTISKRAWVVVTSISGD